MSFSHLPLEHVHNRIHCIGASESDLSRGRSLQTVATQARTHTSVSPYIISHRPTQQDFRPVTGQPQSHGCPRPHVIASAAKQSTAHRPSPQEIGFVSHTLSQRSTPDPVHPCPNWVCFAELAPTTPVPGPRPTEHHPELALFCTTEPPALAPSRPAMPGIGFVFPRPVACPIVITPFSQSAYRPSCSGQIGFVLHNRSWRAEGRGSVPNPQSRNWLCFALLPLAVQS